MNKSDKEDVIVIHCPFCQVESIFHFYQLRPDMKCFYCRRKFKDVDKFNNKERPNQ